MDHIRQLGKHFVPTRLQTAYCALIACLVALYWCRDQILYGLTSGSHTSTSDLNDSFRETLNAATNNSVGSTAALAVFWALAGLVVLAIIYESFNLVISARNDYLIATTYTNVKAYEQNVARDWLLKLLPGVGFLFVIIMSWAFTLSIWHDLISQPAHVFFHLKSMSKELVGLLGLAVNVYLIWMWLVFLVPRLFRKILV